MLGLGSAAQLKEDAVRHALVELDYRLVDTASMDAPWYKNEDKIGEIIRSNDLKRTVFITTKMHAFNQGYDYAWRSFQASKANLGPIDLYLLHYTHCMNPDGCDGTWKDSWRALEDLYMKNEVKAIGLSNVFPAHVQEIVAEARVIPHVIQNRFDLFNQDRQVVHLCRKHHIFYQGYSTLGGQYWNREVNPVLTNPVVQEIANELEVHPSQVVLKWAVQQHIGVLPRSQNFDRLKLNSQVWSFYLSETHLKKLNELDGEGHEFSFEVSVNRLNW